jgi:NAD(P)-dependent dehydrogenase (short-subunit alcohol dehydrogenase family)
MAGMMEGKVALVTGAGGGIGREIALAMAKAGARVLINDIGALLSGEGRSGTPAEETKRLIEAAGGEAAISTDSVAEWASAQQIVKAALDRFGRLDAVVNNAGILRDAIFHRMSPEDWLAVISVHLNGSFFVSRAAADQYRKQESGAFVHVTSTSGLIGNMGQANYASAKLGITALSKAIAIDMRRFNVRSNCLSPWAWSRMTQSIPAQNDEQRARLAKLQRMTPDKNAPMRGDGAGVRHAPQRDLPVQFAAANPHPAPGRRVDAGSDRRARAAGPQTVLHAGRSLRRGVPLGPDLRRVSCREGAADNRHGRSAFGPRV